MDSARREDVAVLEAVLDDDRVGGSVRRTTGVDCADVRALRSGWRGEDGLFFVAGY